jgi:hypothetical protein
VTSVTASANWPARPDSSLLRAPSPAATNAPISDPHGPVAQQRRQQPGDRADRQV